MFVHVESESVPPGAPNNLSEQVICFNGPVTGLEIALPAIASHLEVHSSEHWFADWANNSYAGLDIPSLQLFVDARGGPKSGAKGGGKDDPTHPLSGKGK